MSRKSISFFNAINKSDGIVLTWYKSASFFEKNREDEFSEFSIYRKECKDFEFGVDYSEYFNDVDIEGSDLIYRGKSECSNNRKYEFLDRNAERNCVYAYFIHSKTMPPLGPAPVKRRDLDVWWPYEKMKGQIECLLDKYPDLIEKTACGRTVEGREIYALKIGRGNPFLGLIGAVHPGEAGPELIVSALDGFLGEKPQMLKERSIVTIPSVNIDMRERLSMGTPWYLRLNSSGVDLNRNFPADWDIVSKIYGLSSDDRESMTFRGEFPKSEPETQSIISFFKENTPRCIFSFHALAGICGLPALASGGIEKSDGDFYKLSEFFASEYASGLYPEQISDGAYLSFGGSEGSFTRWCWHALKIPGFDLEMSPKFAPEALNLCRLDKSTPELLEEYAKRHSNAIKNIMSVPDFI